MKCEVDKILNLSKTTTMSQYEIAGKFNVNQSTVSRILNKKIWNY